MSGAANKYLCKNHELKVKVVLVDIFQTNLISGKL